MDETVVVEEKEVGAKYSLGAFFLSFAYYQYMGLWVYFLIAYVLTVILPFQVYFSYNLILSVVLYRRNLAGKDIGKPHRKWGIIVGCISVLSCFVCKYWLNWFIISLL